MCLALTLVACDKDGTTDEEKRVKALDELVSQILVSSNDAWTCNMPKERVEQLKNAGDYYALSSWATFTADVIDKSGLQTAKIDTITRFLATEKGKNLLRGEGAEILEIIHSLGLTSTDAENIVFTALVLYLENGDPRDAYLCSR